MKTSAEHCKHPLHFKLPLALGAKAVRSFLSAMLQEFRAVKDLKPLDKHVTPKHTGRAPLNVS